ncbi:hypothetical protein LTR70_010518 [Exophiala xenobiotica]|uniref:Uncharacterized protein n=1 Tax=Lithohypha guttulata TaxID=1690604 RepID=A0ABR0JTZ2_9EURO|nr:hypothetical protein LTR24_010498 [Lithohypha guttulata]KAK5309205.1 hypothetical protein LTR70_010518 [Exophiala xenobiotica]
MISANAHKNNHAAFEMGNTSYNHDLEEFLLQFLENRGILTQLRWPPPRTHVETADVPIVSTPRDLRIDPPPAPPASRVLGSPFPYHRRQSSDKRETVIGPGDQLRRVSGAQLEPSRELFAWQDPEQPNVI